MVLDFLNRVFAQDKDLDAKDIKTEVIAGITTFLTMAYILIVNPMILGDAGMDMGAVFTATAIASAVATMVMAVVAKLPIALAPGMGLNAFFAYVVVLGMGYSWQVALTAVLIEGVIFLVLSFLNIREAIIEAIPLPLKKAVSVGIGLFIAFIGLQNAGIVVSDPATFVSLGGMNFTVVLTMVGAVVIAALMHFRVKGAILIGMAGVTVLGIFTGDTSFPEWSWSIPSLAPTFFAFEFVSWDLIPVVFTFLFVDIFDTAGTLVGVTTKAGLVEADGNPRNMKAALFADAVGTTVGAMLGTSTVTSYIESASGVAEGGRTGLTSAVTSVLFIVALFLSPLFLAVPVAATSSALLIVGMLMMGPILDIEFGNHMQAMPVFLTILLMPLTYSISNGILFGVLSYVAISVAIGRYKEIHKGMWVLAVVFLAWLVI